MLIKRRVLKNRLPALYSIRESSAVFLDLPLLLLMNFMNDGRLVALEIKSLAILAVMLGIGIILYAVYKYAMNKAEKIVM